MNVKQYLDRIGLSQVEKPNLEYLALLQKNHLLSVPFENLGIHQGMEIALNPEHLFNKIVLRRRGGFCYKLNGLFAWLLRNVGFDVSIISARVYDSNTSAYSPEFDHMVLLVRLSQTFLVDVGCGDCFRKPIPLPDGSVEDLSGQYRIRPSRLTHDGFRVDRLGGAGWEIQYCFEKAGRKLEDFIPMCLYHQTSPDSHFTLQMVCTIATPDGRKTLSSENLTISEGGAIKKTPIPSRDTFYRLLFEHFGTSLDLMDEGLGTGR